MSYDIQHIVSNACANGQFQKAYDGALALLMRLDERLLRADEGLRSGIEARLDFQEAQSLVGLGGGFLHLNDLVLFEADTNSLLPSEDAIKGRRFVARRRALRRLSARELLASESLSQITGLEDLGQSFGQVSSSEDERTEAVDGVEEVSALLHREQPRQTDFASVFSAAKPRPALLGALLLFDHWRLHEDDRVSETGPFLVAAYLKGRNLTRAHMAGMASGLWRQSPKWQRGSAPADRLTRAADAIAEAARKTMADMDRLVLARETLRRKLPKHDQAGSQSTLSLLIDLFMAEPLVTVELASRRLKITPQAVEYQFQKLGTSLPREMTGRKRYRAWGI